MLIVPVPSDPEPTSPIRFRAAVTGGVQPGSGDPGVSAAAAPPCEDAAAPCHARSGSAPVVSIVEANGIEGLVQVITRIFARLDRDGDRRLSRNEVDTAMHDPRWHGREAAAIAALAMLETNSLRQAARLANDRVGREGRALSLQDLTAMATLPTDSALLNEAAWNFDLARLKIEHTDRSRLFKDGIRAVSADGVTQGAVGDCFFMAAVAGLADARPQQILDMMARNADGTYTVTFPGPVPITVTPPTDAEIGRFASALDRGMWLTVLEKAYAQWNQGTALAPATDAYRTLDRGGMTGEGIRAMTGANTTFRLTKFSPASDGVAAIRTALADRRVVVAVTRHRLADAIPGTELLTGHAFTVLAFDAEQGRFLVRCPNGRKNGESEGRYLLTPAEFRHHFDGYAIEDP